MINNSSLMVYSVLKNLQKRYDKCKVVSLYNTSAYEFVYETRTPIFIVNHCKRVYNDIENCIYTYADVVALYLYRKLFGLSTIVKDITTAAIARMRSELSDVRYKADRDLIDDIPVDELFKYDPDVQRNDAYLLVAVKKQLSIGFYLRNMIKFPLTQDGEIIILDSDFGKFHTTACELLKVVKHLSRRGSK